MGAHDARTALDGNQRRSRAGHDPLANLTSGNGAEHGFPRHADASGPDRGDGGGHRALRRPDLAAARLGEPMLLMQIAALLGCTVLAALLANACATRMLRGKGGAVQ